MVTTTRSPFRPALAALVAAIAVLATMVVVAEPALAVAPSNDDSASATTITPLPFHYAENTTDATTSAEEAAIQPSCGAPRVEHGVWFTATTGPDVGAGVKIDTTQSDYSAGIAFFAGSPGALSFLGCVPGQFSGPSSPNTTFYLLIFGDGGFDGNQPTSGNLVLDIRALVAAPTLAVTVDRSASVSKQGVLHVTGTATCTSGDGQGFLYGVYVQVRQLWGRLFIDGSASVFVGAPCDGVAHPWSADMTGTNGLFGGGRATSVSTSYGCGTDFCNNSGPVWSTLRLNRSA